jgi:phage I-like protein
MGKPGDLRAQSIGTTTDGRELVRMLCEVVEDVPATDAQAEPPRWIHIMPFGPLVEARDGRAFQVSDALAVAARTETPLVIDWDHESEYGKTRAAGWVEELRVQEGDGEMPHPGVWGRATWTPEGRADVTSRAYRFLSPVVVLESESRDAQQIVAVALTNRPALRMHGLDQFRERLSTTFGRLVDSNGNSGGHTMKAETVTALCAALGITPGADDTAILDAVKARGTGETIALREANSVLKLELSETRTKLSALEAKHAEVERAEFAARVERVLEKAAADGKVTPASSKKWREFACKSPENLAMFEADILPDLAKVGDAAPPPPKGKGAASDTKLGRYGVSKEEAEKAEQYNRERVVAAESEA